MAQPLLLLPWALLALALTLTLTLTGANLPLADGEPLEPYDRLFDAAVNSYHRNDWQGVIINMERALKNQQVLCQVKTNCRLQCNNQTGFVSSTSNRDFLFDLNFFNTVLRKAECLRACESARLGPDSLHQVTEETQLEFQKRTPYNYLQVAYFKIKKLDKAVAAAYTFYIANPEHVEMQQNLEYYKLMAGVKDTDFTDLEAKPHMESYRAGVRLYTNEQFLASIELFEKALVQYFQADMECRALCEGPYLFDGYSYMDYNADLFQAITDHYVQILSCRQNCAVQLASRPGKEKPVDNFLPAHYDHLQFAYYNTENYEKAIECSKTYLLFYPKDEVMNQNQQYYEAVLGAQLARHIHARERVHSHINSSLLEKELLYFANEVFGIMFIDPDAWTPENVMPVKLREKQKTERETAARISEEIGNLMKEIEHLVDEKTKESVDIVKMVREGGPLLFDGVEVVMNSKMMNGTQRGLMDGVLSPSQCQDLRMLSNLAAMAGDGYRGKPSPHSPNERFQGVTMLKALKLAQEGKVPLRSAKLYYDASEKVRRIVESYYRLEKPLHFSYTHLVCRIAVEGNQGERVDLSHSIHVDNCILNSEALECRKEIPAYTQRDYSAILYFNNDFEGGEFIFTELDAKSVTARVKPDCGRLISFSSGSENPHGVEAVTKGQRCGLALWFTLDPRQRERDRFEADELVKMLFNLDVDQVAVEGLAVAEKTPEPSEGGPQSQEGANTQTQAGDQATEMVGVPGAALSNKTPTGDTESHGPKAPADVPLNSASAKQEL